MVYAASDHETDALIALKTLREVDADALLRFKSRAITTRRRDQGMTGMMRVLERQTLALREPGAGARDRESAPTALLYYYFCNGSLAYWHGERERAGELTVELVLMQLLVAAHRYRTASWAARRRLGSQMRRQLGKLRHWARACPQNFAAQHAIARAARASARGEASADAPFAAAVDCARQHGTAMREALALQLWSEHARAEGGAAEADERAGAAVDAFERRGARALAERLRRPGP